MTDNNSDSIGDNIGAHPSDRATHEPGLASRPGHSVSVPCAVLARSLSVYEKPQPARLILARALGISIDEAGDAITALIQGGYGVAPRNPTNGMLAACLEALTPPTGHEQVITAISKARVRWQAMLSHGTAMAMSRKRLAIATETQRAETTSGSVEDEGAGRSRHRPNTVATQPTGEGSQS